IGGKIKAHNYDPKIDKVMKEAQDDLKQKQVLSDLIFTGYIDNEELPVLYEQAEIFIFPSLYEGFGLPLIEAMISKTPVICSDIECFQEIAGDAARFYKAQSQQDLQKAMLEVIMKPEVKEKLVQKGTKNATKYSWEKSARETLATFIS
ncbi:MAG: glycosyltransferase, partial [Candidatus Moranbacteria bacterium]|nr:glycosyltransferase [Candidatus Moranbacteria bacterium]